MGIETMKPRDVQRLLRSNGWIIKSSKGSHEKWEHPTTHRVFVMPAKGTNRNRLIHMNSLKSIIREMREK